MVFFFCGQSVRIRIIRQKAAGPHLLEGGALRRDILSEGFNCQFDARIRETGRRTFRTNRLFGEKQKKPEKKMNLNTI